MNVPNKSCGENRMPNQEQFMEAYKDEGKAVRTLQGLCHDNSVKHGFWDEGPRQMIKGGRTGDQEVIVPMYPWNFGEKISLMHTELSEALEKHRNTIGKGLPEEPDEHCPNHSGIEIEFADAIIRIFDTAEKMGYDMGKAVLAKMAFNAGRPFKHGKAY